jgi:hypothetical protein
MLVGGAELSTGASGADGWHTVNELMVETRA